jgi:hypothetical protein
MKKVKFICMALLAMVAMASCRGPQGPQGPAGNANVASSTLTIYPNDWNWDQFYVDDEGYSRGQYWVTVDYQNITENVFNYGAVLVYMDVNGAWSQLPLTYYYEDGDYLAEASLEVATLSDGGVTIYWTQSDFWKVQPDTHAFKIVAIEANYYQSRSDVNYSDYESVKTAFQLAD